MLVLPRRRGAPRSGEDGGGDDGGGDDGGGDDGGGDDGGGNDGGGDDGGGDDPPPPRGGNALTPLQRSEIIFLRSGLWSHPFGRTLAMTITEKFCTDESSSLFALGQAMGRSTRPLMPAGQLQRASWNLFSLEVVEFLGRPLHGRP